MLYPSLKPVSPPLHYQEILVLYQVCILYYSVNEFLRIFSNSYGHNASLQHFNPKQQNRVEFLLNFLQLDTGGSVRLKTNVPTDFLEIFLSNLTTNNNNSEYPANIGFTFRTCIE